MEEEILDIEITEGTAVLCYCSGKHPHGAQNRTSL